MKSVIVLATALFANLAYADYFNCQIEVDGDRQMVEAEYRVLESSVTLNGLTCAGSLKNHQTTVSLFDGMGIIVEKVEMGTYASITFDDSQKEPVSLVKCSCGLN